MLLFNGIVITALDNRESRHLTDAFQYGVRRPVAVDCSREEQLTGIAIGKFDVNMIPVAHDRKDDIQRDI